MMFPVFATVFFLLLSAASVGVYRHVARLLGLRARGRRRLAFALGGGLLCTLGLRAVERHLPESVARVAGSVALDIELAIFIAGLLLLAVDGGDAAVKFVRKHVLAP